jgi:CHAT domain-containing protein
MDPSQTSLPPELPHGPVTALRRLLLAGCALGLLLAGAEVGRGEATDARTPRAEAAMAEGAAALERGRFEEAAARFGEGTRLYAAAGNPAARIGALMLLAHAQQALGEYRDAARSLGDALALAEGRRDKAQLAAILGALGNVRIAIGPADDAERTLVRAAAVAREVGDPRLTATTLNNLGNHYASQKAYPKAVAAYEESAALATRGGNSLLAAQAVGNAARAIVESGDGPRARASAEAGYERARALPPSHDKAYLLIQLGRSFARIAEATPASRPVLRLRSFEILREAERVATEIEDARAASYALGYQGALYEQEGRSREALELTQRTIFQAQQLDAPESLYLWHWQAGRLLRELGGPERAIAAYGETVQILEGLRHQLTVVYGAAGTSFETSVGAVYFELVDLLLRRAAAAEDPQVVQQLLVRARNTVELLKKAELRDYFRDECVDALPETIRNPWQLSQSAVVVYPILLPDRTELLLSFGSAKIERYSVPIGREQMASEIRLFREHLEARTTNQYRREAQRLYDWLVRPFASQLRDRGIDTLVFVPWGPLGTVPMAALHDGAGFLIEQYAVAIVPGIELTDPRPLDRRRIKLFLSGLSESVDGFPPLERVPMELESVKALYGGRILVDESFRLDAVKDILGDEQFNVVHIATHGEFSGEADESFLLAYDGRLTMEGLAEDVGLFRFRDTPLELLTLSACETAQGDERAALGLSGVALKAGARSALATLWKVSDVAAAQLVIDFYSELRDPSVSRAQALQRAQRKALELLPYDHPGYWSPFVLIGSWL